MNSILYSVFISLLLRMSIITAVILTIKAVFRRKLSAFMHSAIWLIPVLQFVFCVSGVEICANVSIYNLITPETQKFAVFGSDTLQAAAGGGFDIKNIAAFGWLFSSLVVLMWYVFVYIRHRHSLLSLTKVTDEGILNMLENLKQSLDIQDSIVLYYGKSAQTTANMIIIPEDFPSDELKQIMLHELCHYKNRDCFKLWVSIIILSFNWFNPLMWYAFRKFRTDIEMLCDDRVLKCTDSKKCYATALVHSSMAKSRFIPGTTALHNGKSEVKKRIKRLISWKKKKPVWAVIASCVCVAASCIFLTDAVTAVVEKNTDIASTPEPIVRPTAIPAPAETVYPKENALSGTEASYSYENSNADTYSYDTPEDNTGSQETDDVRNASIGSNRSDIYEEFGEPQSSSPNGTKEIYSLPDGTTAVLQYEDDALAYGYIVEGELPAASDFPAEADDTESEVSSESN